MEVVATKLRALLDACAAVRRCAAASGGDADELSHLRAVPLDAGLPGEDRAYWDALSEEHDAQDARGEQSLLEDIGVLLATSDADGAAIARALEVMMAHASFNCAGLVHLAHLTLRGLKLAKRWDDLALLSTRLSDAAYARVLQPATMERALGLWIEIVVGFQHTGEMYEQNVDKLVTVAEFFDDEANGGSPADAQFARCKREFVSACAALIHYHRGYEEENARLQRAIRRALRDTSDWPTTAEAERVLRDTAWVLPASRMDRYFPSIEGKWVADEFADDTLIPSAVGVRNSGSVLFKKLGNCFAHAITASIENAGEQAKPSTVELNGYLMQQLPGMQTLLADPQLLEQSQWTIEGHWRQIQSEEGSKTSAASAPVVLSTPDWDCQACTMKNTGNSPRCSTCGTIRVSSGSSSVVASPAGSNPAPFAAVFDASLSFLRVKWSRGEQQGVWLARREFVAEGFDLQIPLQTLGDAMSDNTRMPMHAFSTQGQGSSVLVLERPVLTSTSHAEYTIQVWVQPKRAPLGAEQQVILANAQEFELSMTSSGILVWQVTGGRYTVMSGSSLEFGKLHHVMLSMDASGMTMLVDQQVVGQVAKSPELETYGPLPPGTASLLTIGGSFDTASPSTSSWSKACFHGTLLDLRVWSVAGASSAVQEHDVNHALSGREDNLLAYLPLVGNTQRLLMDLTKNANHANTVEAFQLSQEAMSVCHGNFAPTVGLQDLPVKNLFSVSLGDEFIGSGAFSLDAGKGLLVESEAAIWCHNPLAKAATCGFETRFSLEFDVADSASAAPGRCFPVKDAVVFAMCAASFWDLAPLLPEAAAVAPNGLGASASGSPSWTSDRSALLVKITAELDPSRLGAMVHSLGLYVCTQNQSYPLARVDGIAASPGSTSVEAKIAYSLPERVVSIVLGGEGGVAFNCAVDLERALQLKEGTGIRTGLVFPCARRPDGAASIRRLTAWSLVETAGASTAQDDAVGPTSASILERVYGSMSTTEGSSSASATNSDEVTCSRVANDGSAIEQEAFGCQTCDLVHGNGICRTCAILCHQGHELVAMGAATIVCGCRSRAVGSCVCESPVKKQEHPALDNPVRTSHWRCSKCTVVNGQDEKQCTVCGNGAPTVSSPGSSPAPVVSTSRALVLAEPKPAPSPVTVPPADWACGACTMLNEAGATKCTICDTPRPITAGAGEEETKTTDGLVTLYSAATTAPVETSSWICSACTMENSASDQVCHMCSTTRAVPVAEAVDSSGVSSERGTASDSISMEIDGMSDGAAAVVPVAAAVPDAATHTPAESLSAIVSNIIFLHGHKRTVAEAISRSLDVETLQQSVWELTTGKMTLSIEDSFVGEYVQGTYLERDGNVYGLARITEDGSWRLAGRFKKHSQSQENACVLQWDPACSRFEGKWYRGDGSGDWKCIAAPYASDFRGLATPESTNSGQPTTGANSAVRGSSGELQPFYLGLLNMKENLTNVCYQNSFLQALYMTRALRRLLLSTATTTVQQQQQQLQQPPQQQQLLLPRIQDLFARMTSSQRPFIDTHALQRCLPPDFVSGRQQDTSDFAHYLMDAMTQEMEAIERENERTRPTPGGNQSEDTGDGVLATHDPAHRIAEIFGGHQATILSCKSCGKTSVNREYFWELLLNMIDLRYTPITDIRAVTGSSSMDIQTPHGYERLNADLNKDRAGAPYVYLCLKRRPERDEDGHNSSKAMAITDIVIKVAPISDPKPTVPGYDRVELDLNVGGSAIPMAAASSTAASAVVATSGGKKQVYLFYRREPDGVPITDLQVVYGNDAVPDGFKQIPIDLNQGVGSRVLLCYRCDMPITDVQIVNGGIPGYRMVDHLLNRDHDDAVKQYLALKVGGNEPCLTDLKLVDGKDVPEFQSLGWQAIGSPMSFHSDAMPALSDNGDGESEAVMFSPPQLMVRRGHGNPIFAIDVFRAPRQVPKYNDYEVIDLYPSPASAESLPTEDVTELSTAMTLPSLRGDWMGTEATERVRRAVRIRTESAPVSNALLIKGELDDKGELVAVATARTAWAPTATVPSVDGAEAAGGGSAGLVYNVTGYWTSSKTKRAQLFDVELRPSSTALMDEHGSNAYSMEGKMSDTARTASPVAIRGVQMSRQVKVKWPISEVLVLRGDERVPEGVQLLRETVSGRTGNLLTQTASPHTLYLAVKRDAEPAEGFVTDVCVIYAEIDAVPEGYVSVQLTPGGHSANLNDGTAGVPVFVCYRRQPPGTDVDAAKSDKCVMDLALMWTSGAQADTLPAGFSKIQHTPLGMEANLNQGTSGVAIHLCVSKSSLGDVVQPIEHALNGEYELSSLTSSPLAFGRFVRLAVVEQLAEARSVEGSFGAVLHGYLHGSLRGVLFSTASRAMPQRRMLLGVWTSEGGNGAASMTDFVPPSHPFLLALDEASGELDGWWSGPEPASSATGLVAAKPSTSPTNSAGGAKGSATASSGGKGAPPLGEPWRLVRDSYVRIAFKKDYGTEWQDGKLVFSERVWQHDLASMLSRFVATRTMGGDNALRCSACGDGRVKTESRAHTVIAAPPEHLIITLKRMYYDWTQQKTRKCLHDVAFAAHLTLPALSDEEARQVGVGVVDDDEGADAEGADTEMAGERDAPTVARARRFDGLDRREYGLYGVLVHSGLTANSGHYYSFCRESDERTRQLHLEDAPRAPWVKFNDTKVERSSWRELRRHVSNTVADTVYLLLYKRLHYDVPARSAGGDDEAAAAGESVSEGVSVSEGASGDEEAMLLAKAMALSMAAATKPASEEETKEGDAGGGEEDTAAAVDDADDVHGLVVNKALLKTIEAENAAFMRDTLAATASRVHCDDLHTLVLLRRSLQPLAVADLLG